MYELSSAVRSVLLAVTLVASAALQLSCGGSTPAGQVAIGQWPGRGAEDGFHALRKTAITNWLEAKLPLHEVREMAGHSSIETTIKYYAKVDRAAIDRARVASVRYSTKAPRAG